MSIIANTVGIIGVVLMLLAYYQLQRARMTSHEPRYLWLNFSGAVMVVFSLFWAWNWPAFLIESAWAVISLASLIKGRKSV